MRIDRHWVIILLIVLISTLSCNKGISQKKNNKIKIWCIRKDKNEILLKIENHDIVSYYIPTEFFIQYKYGHDSLYFDAVSNKKLEGDSFYYYSQFGGSIITGQSIKGLIADSIINKNESIMFNQFIAPSLIEIKPNTYLTKLEKIKLPFNLKNAVVRIYTDSFTLKKYSYDDFTEFERGNSFLITAPIYEVVNPY